MLDDLDQAQQVVQLKPVIHASDELAEGIKTFARERLPSFKCPRSVDFVDDLPRLPSGKIQRRQVRNPYWAGRERQI